MSSPIPDPPIVILSQYIADKVYGVFGITISPVTVRAFVMLLVPVVALMAVVLVVRIWAKRNFPGKRPGKIAVGGKEKYGDDKVNNLSMGIKRVAIDGTACQRTGYESPSLGQ